MSTPCCQSLRSNSLVVSEYEVPKVLSFQEWIVFFETPCRLLYLCQQGKVSSNFWVDGKVWMSSNPKNIARKHVQEMAEIS